MSYPDQGRLDNALPRPLFKAALSRSTGTMSHSLLAATTRDTEEPKRCVNPSTC
jgi:hypothetical protein